MKPLMLDLFSGLGGASQAMVDRGWRVVRVDINPLLNPDIVADVRDFHWDGERPDLIWASPPCEEFTRHALPWTRRKNPPPPDLSPALAVKRIVEETKPVFWVVENVRGAVPWFTSIFGPARKRVGSRYLWGHFPPFDCPHLYGKYRLPPCSRRSLLRSKIPYSLSLSLAVAVEAWLASYREPGGEKC
ncbi:MAG: hypothetical protein QW356_06010 [Candidatus Hadarchaeales archaeon]